MKPVVEIFSWELEKAPGARLTGFTVNWDVGVLGPTGEEAAVKVAFPLRPILPTEMAEVVAVPATTLAITGFAPMVKSPVTMTLRITICARPPLVACIVME